MWGSIEGREKRVEEREMRMTMALETEGREPQAGV
jgi:hypothetical protein